MIKINFLPHLASLMRIEINIFHKFDIKTDNVEDYLNINNNNNAIYFF